MKKFLLDNQKTAEKISNFLKQEFKKRNKTKAILGLSGGIDSTVTGLLCQKAGLDLCGVLLPYRKKGLEESKKVAQFLKLAKTRVFIIDIGPAVDAQIKELQKKITLDRADKGNIMARQRMIVQYALARRLNGLVMGTENLSEYYLGYFTLHGDQASDISAINGLFKTQVYDLGKYLGAPPWVLERKPTAGLWKGQTDEGEFGFTYKEADQILYSRFVLNYSKDRLISKQEFAPEAIEKVLARVKATEYKRQEPPKCDL